MARHLLACTFDVNGTCNQRCESELAVNALLAREIYELLRKAAHKAGVLGARRAESMVNDAGSELGLWCHEHNVKDPKTI